MKPFSQYHREHPEIWKEFKKITLQVIREGFKHYSSKSIFEAIRWRKRGEIKSDGFKVNNNYTADYARMFAKEFPQYKDFFRTRQRQVA